MEYVQSKTQCDVSRTLQLATLFTNQTHDTSYRVHTKVPHQIAHEHTCMRLSHCRHCGAHNSKRNFVRLSCQKIMKLYSDFCAWNNRHHSYFFVGAKTPFNWSAVQLAKNVI